MKIILSQVLLLLSSLVFSQNSKSIALASDWKFRKYSDTLWLPATVPGCVHTDLLANKLIQDPLFGDNEKAAQWIENEDWEYEKTFIADEKLLKYNHLELNFEGLDTYAYVYLNDSLILKADNMFLGWAVDVKKYIHTGENTLHIKFNSSIKTGKELLQNYPVKLPGDERVFTRKAQYTYGWDFAPRLVTCGIWKAVYLNAWNKAQIGEVNVYTKQLTDDAAQISIAIQLTADKHTTYTALITDAVTHKKIVSKKITDGLDSIAFKIDSPKLWWTYQLGDPYLYHYTIEIRKGLKHITSKNISFGIRKIKLIETQDSVGQSFYFQLNGVPMFAKGANIIPPSIYPSAIKENDYAKLLSEAKSMQMNMLRVWGGGIYHDDSFYSLCDSLGILVWQDFMFAGGMYPIAANENSYTKEITDQYNRLKNHPCIALFCGNNEIDEGWKNWDWQKQYNYSQKDSAFVWNQYDDFFNHKIADKLIDESNNNYHPSSPTIGWGRKESLLEGDAHYWGVWWGLEPFDVYTKKIPRFMSEYGFQSMPCANSFKQYISPAELKGSLQKIITAPTIKNHQKHAVGDETIYTYMQRDYKIPPTIEDYIYVSQLLQAQGMQLAIEAHRRNMPYCMGSLFWQLNDCWPGTTWSVLDYFGNRKAAYYSVKKEYNDVILSTIIEQNNIHVYAISDKQQPVTCTLSYKLITTFGQLLKQGDTSITMQHNASHIYFDKPLSNFIGNADTNTLVFYTEIKYGDSILANNFFTFVKPVHLMLQKPQFITSFSKEENIISITSNVYVKNLYLYTEAGELKLDDNFFDMLPGVTKKIHVENQQVNDVLINRIKVKALNIIYTD